MKWILSCHEATRLSSDRLDQPLSFSQQTALRLHLMICPGCRKFARDINCLHHCISQLAAGAAPVSMPEELKTALRQKLREVSQAPTS